jgi:hypothetical protein
MRFYNELIRVRAFQNYITPTQIYIILAQFNVATSSLATHF